MIVVGGTYDEFCFEPRWQEKYGSGLRACRAITSIDPNIDIQFKTFGNDNTELYLKQIEIVFPRIKSDITKFETPVSFYYDHPLITPRIFPRLDTINKQLNNLNIAGDDVLYFGLIEGSANVAGDRVVYDPQSPTNPIPFSQTGSSAKELAVVINYNEASRMARTYDVEAIKKFFLEEEKAEVLVLKMGAKGAIVFSKSGEENIIPVYKTETVWPIGSGDVFAACFAYYWFSDFKAADAAEKASLLTAHYCSTKSFDFANISKSIKPITIQEFPKGKIYLAGPFFTYAERWLIDQIRTCLLGARLDVFSPWHDIGHGIASDVVSKDIEGLENSKLVLAVIDGLDSGTLFEVGYAVSKKIPVIAYVQNETEESIKMLEGTGCILEPDLTTAIYKCVWTMAENE